MSIYHMYLSVYLYMTRMLKSEGKTLDLGAGIKLHDMCYKEFNIQEGKS